MATGSIRACDELRNCPAALHADTLAAYLKTHLAHHRIDALKRLAEVLLALLQAESTL